MQKNQYTLNIILGTRDQVCCLFMVKYRSQCMEKENGRNSPTHLLLFYNILSLTLLIYSHPLYVPQRMV